MAQLFHAYIYQPFLSLLISIYNTVALHDLGFAIILLTLLVRVVLFPIFYRGTKDQTLLQHLQPHVKQIQLDHKDDKELQAKKLMELYAKHKVNPFSGFLLLLVQLPIFIALFRIFTNELGSDAFSSTMFLGGMDLSEKSLVLTILAAGAQYVQGKLSAPKTKDTGDKNPMASFGKTMIYIGPAITIVILMNLPAAIGLYWLASTLFSVAQQVYINKKMPPLPDLEQKGKNG